MVKIILLTDYLGRFESKYNSEIYKNGMDKNLLKDEFIKFGYKAEFIPFYKVQDAGIDWSNSIVLFGSQEDVGHHYKSFIEDIVYTLELRSAKLIPSYKFLKAHSNKVFMELLREQYLSDITASLDVKYFGALEELFKSENEIKYPIVVKGAEGAMSSNVALAANKSDLIKEVKKLSSSRNILEEARESIRSYKYNGYQKQSKYRKKFILQQFLPGLDKDWKVLVFGDKYYVIERKVRKNDFRASGSGNQYLIGSNVSLPEGLLEKAKLIREALDIPMVSLDFAKYDGKFFLLEFQAVYFGTSGHSKSDVYFEILNDTITKKENTYSLEKIYAESISKYLDSKL